MLKSSILSLYAFSLAGFLLSARFFNCESSVSFSTAKERCFI
jgi:hypothetical protein